MSNGTNSAPEWTDKVAMDTQNVAGAINAALNISGPNVTTVVVNDSVGGGDYSTISGATPGQVLRLVGAGANPVNITNGANFILSQGNRVLYSNDVLTLVCISATVCVEASWSNNTSI